MKKAGMKTLPFLSCDYGFYFLNFLLNPINPASPELRRSMVEGRGTGLLGVISPKTARPPKTGVSVPALNELISVPVAMST